MTIKFTYMRHGIFIAIAFIAICTPSCKNNNQKDNATKIVSEWTGKEVRFPKDLPCTSMGKDTSCIDLQNDNYKIMLYVDSLGCTNCRLRLAEWKKIIDDSDSVFNRRPDFIFFFQPKKKDEKELQFIFKQNGFRHPIFIDKENEINKLNNFPSQTEYQCYLLHKNNKVLIVGNPSLNPGIWALYKKVITEREANL